MQPDKNWESIVHEQREVIRQLEKRLAAALNFVEHQQATAGLSLTDAEWDERVARYRASGVAEIQIARSYLPKAHVDLVATRAVLAAAAPFLLED